MAARAHEGTCQALTHAKNTKRQPQARTQQRRVHALGHARAVAAHVHRRRLLLLLLRCRIGVGAALRRRDERRERGAVLSHALLHVHLLSRVARRARGRHAREGGHQARQRAVLCPSLQLCPVQKILLRAAAAEKQPRLATR
jgi:hypothetical protein